MHAPFDNASTYCFCSKKYRIKAKLLEINSSMYSYSNGQNCEIHICGGLHKLWIQLGQPPIFALLVNTKELRDTSVHIVQAMALTMATAGLNIRNKCMFPRPPISGQHAKGHHVLIPSNLTEISGGRVVPYIMPKMVHICFTVNGLTRLGHSVRVCLGGLDFKSFYVLPLH